MTTVRVLSISRYMQAALKKAEYVPDEHGVIIARVPGAQGFYSQGETFEDARENLRDAIEGNLTLALQLGLPIPTIDDIVIELPAEELPKYMQDDPLVGLFEGPTDLAAEAETLLAQPIGVNDHADSA